MRLRLAATALAVTALTGCSHAAAPAALHTPPTTSSVRGPAAFASWLRAQGYFGSKDFGTSTDDQILGFGNVVCDGFRDQSLTYGRMVQGLMVSVAHPQASQAEELTKQATLNLCPEYASRLPS